MTRCRFVSIKTEAMLLGILKALTVSSEHGKVIDIEYMKPGKNLPNSETTQKAPPGSTLFWGRIVFDRTMTQGQRTDGKPPSPPSRTIPVPRNHYV